MEEKRELVYQVSEWSEGAPELLQSWSRQDILQILSAESGKERKYTGLSKLKIIEILLQVVADKKSQVNKNKTMSDHERATKKQRKSDNILDLDTACNEIKLCKNLVCRAKLGQEDAFCKRCSCCICHQYDDNKDPSLWLICSSENPYQGKSCAMTCHLECALQHEKSGIPNDGQNRELDGSFYCVSCGKVNDLLQCWRKQMTTARDTRRVDILCYRVSLSQKLLTGTVRYKNVHKIVNEAIEKLEVDVGPLTGLPVKRARGIINRLASGQEVQRLCAFAVESLDSIISNTHVPAVKDFAIMTPNVKYENVCSSSLSNPSSVDDENNNVVGFKDVKMIQTDKCDKVDKNTRDDEDKSVKNGKEFDQIVVSISEGDLPFTPCKEKSLKDGNLGRKSRQEALKNNLDDGSLKKGGGEEGQDRDFGYYVKVIRWLECKEHIDKSFREKFLTWYSLKAGPQEVRIVKVFIDTLMEDPVLLAGQLVDTFSEAITSKKCSKGLCLKLFH